MMQLNYSTIIIMDFVICCLLFVQNEGPKIHNLPDVAYIHEDVATKTAIFDLSVTDLESDQYTCLKADIVPGTLSFDVEDVGNKGQKPVLFLCCFFLTDFFERL